MSNKDEEMICALTADEHAALRQGLEALPETMPPRIVWERIREQAEAEGLIRAQKPAVSRPMLAGIGLLAASVMVALLIPALQTEPLSSTEPPVAELTNTTPVNALQALMVESRQLEANLRQLPAEPRVMQAGTLATISDIEDRIAGIDYQLNDPSRQMTDDETEIFWRERVRLMKLLVHLRYAQTQRNAF